MFGQSPSFTRRKQLVAWLHRQPDLPEVKQFNVTVAFRPPSRMREI
jgi:hypothetical protein